jgi:hypothetical protein
MFQNQKIILDSNEVKVIYKGKLWVPLIDALYNALTQKQKDKILIKVNNELIMFKNELINCFEAKCKDTDLYSDENNECICGVHIHLNHTILNKITKEEFIIGSECINNWDVDKELKACNKIIRSIRKKQDIPIFCYFCKRENSCKRNCIKCKHKENIKLLFNGWKKIAQEKKELYNKLLKRVVKFGKYKNKSFGELCRDKNYVLYIVALLNPTTPSFMVDQLEHIKLIITNKFHK